MGGPTRRWSRRRCASREIGTILKAGNRSTAFLLYQGDAAQRQGVRSRNLLTNPNLLGSDTIDKAIPLGYIRARHFYRPAEGRLNLESPST
jgi:hypothetical protein